MADGRFRPSWVEEDDDFDGGFFLNDDGPERPPKFKVFDPISTPVTSNSNSRGGFGLPKPRTQTAQSQEKKYKRPSDVKEEAETQPLNVGDFQTAIIRGNTERVQEYIDNGFQIDGLLRSGWTGLMYAASSAHPQITKLLLDAGADPNFHKDMYTVLMAACGSSMHKEEDVLEVVSLLLDRKAEVNSHDRYHTSPLMYAARLGRTTVIERLVGTGASLDKQDSRGYTSLTWAVVKRQLSAVRLLLKLKADPYKRHCDGQTVIDMAQAMDDTQLLEILEGKQAGNKSPGKVPPPADLTVNGMSGDGDREHSSDAGRDSYGLTFGELELFLCGLNLGHLVDVVRKQHIDFNTFLRMTEEDLIKIGISQLGVRKKILDGIHDVHKREWDKSSLPSWQYNKHMSCAEALAIMANTSKHMQYVTTTMGYVQDQIHKNPALLEQLQDGTGPKQLAQHTRDALCNLSNLQNQLTTIQTQLEQMLGKGNYTPADLLRAPEKAESPKRWLIPVGLVSAGLLVLTVWKRDVIQQQISTLIAR